MLDSQLRALFLLSIFALSLTTETNLSFHYNTKRELQGPNSHSPQGSSDTSKCPHECDMGSCDQKSGQCVCDGDFFDEDCSFYGTRLLPDAIFGQNIMPQEPKLLFLDIYESGELTISFGYMMPLTIILKFTSQNTFQIPNQAYQDKYQRTPQDQNIFVFKFDKDTVKKQSGQRLLILVENDQKLPVQFAIQAMFLSTSSIITPILIGASTLFAVISMIMCICSIRRKRRLRRAREAWRVRLQVRRAHAQNRGQNGLQEAYNNNGNDEDLNENNIFLTQEELNTFIPEKKFSNLTSKFPQQSCSICLDDFKPEIICRQLYCVHIFHSQCIQLWLKKHQDCPNCKKEMTREAIKKNVSSETKKDRKKGKMKKYELEEDDPPVNQA